MPNASVSALLARLVTEYGEKLLPYGGDFTEVDGLGFQIVDVPASFSAITLDGTLPFGQYDLQIESFPPGDYIYTDRVDTERLLMLVRAVERGDWP